MRSESRNTHHLFVRLLDFFIAGGLVYAEQLVVVGTHNGDDEGGIWRVGVGACARGRGFMNGASPDLVDGARRPSKLREPTSTFESEEYT